MAASTVMRNSTNSVRLRGRKDRGSKAGKRPTDGLAVMDEATGSNPDVNPQAGLRVSAAVQSIALAEFGIDRDQRGVHGVGNAVGWIAGTSNIDTNPTVNGEDFV